MKSHVLLDDFEYVFNFTEVAPHDPNPKSGVG
jgi:hypothetical protein